MVGFFDDEDAEPRVLELIVNARNAEVVRSNLDRLAAAVPAIGDLAGWFGDEMAEAREHLDPDAPHALHLLVKTRQVERFRDDLQALASMLREAQP